MFPVERQHDQDCTPSGAPLTAIDCDPRQRTEDIAHGMTTINARDGVYYSVWWYEDQQCWCWAAYLEVGDPRRYATVERVAGRVRYEDHPNARDVAMDRARRAAELVGQDP